MPREKKSRRLLNQRGYLWKHLSSKSERTACTGLHRSTFTQFLVAKGSDILKLTGVHLDFFFSFGKAAVYAIHSHGLSDFQKSLTHSAVFVCQLFCHVIKVIGARVHLATYFSLPWNLGRTWLTLTIRLERNSAGQVVSSICHSEGGEESRRQSGGESHPSDGGS